MDQICGICRGTGMTIQEAFLAALKRQHDSCALRLIEAGADVNASLSGDPDRTHLRMAVRGRKYQLAKALINAGADVNKRHRSFPILLEAADNPDAEKFVNLLIDAGANVNVSYSDASNSTPLMRAALRGTSPAVVTALINAGADVNWRNSYGESAFTNAAMEGFDEGLNLLIQAADKTDPTRSYLPPLSHIDFYSRTLKISTIKILLRTGIKINMQNIYYKNTLSYYIVDCKRYHNEPKKDICMFLFAAGER